MWPHPEMTKNQKVGPKEDFEIIVGTNSLGKSVGSPFGAKYVDDNVKALLTKFRYFETSSRD